MSHWLAFGLSGAVGSALQAAWRPDEARITAVSRAPRAPRPGIEWQIGDLASWRAPHRHFDAVVSTGPLDAFSRWFADAGPATGRVVALGSTSVHSKAASPDANERALAAALAAAEDRLAAACADRGASLTLLRPTLIYGVGRDRNLSRIVGLARRWHWVPLPRTASGLRQPVHAGDVAAAVLAALRAPTPCAGRFDLPGGEVLRYDEMVRRTLAVAASSARVVRVPTTAFRVALRLAHAAGRLSDAGEGTVDRLARDLVYDAGPVRDALGVTLRSFAPEAAIFADGAAPRS